MPFNRPPRLQVPLPQETVKIPAPPAIPAKPEKNNWLSIGLPIGAVLLSVILMVGVMNTSGSALSYLIFLPIMLISYLTAFLTTGSQKKAYEKKLTEGRAEFRKELRLVEDHLSELYQAEKSLRLKVDPDTGECILMAQKASPDLGSRRPADIDFLNVRIGIGKTPASYKVEAGDRPKLEEFKKEYEFIDQVIEQYAQLDAVPVHARINSAGSIGVSGNRLDVLGVSRGLVLQAVTHHWFGEVNLAVCSSPANFPDWTWIQKLPHTAPAMAFFGADTPSNAKAPDQRFMTALEEELQRREQQVETQKMIKKDDTARTDRPLPRLLVIFDYLPEGYQHAALQLLARKGHELGVHGIFLTKHESQVPGFCGAVITCNGNQLTYRESGIEGYSRECVADLVSINQAEIHATALANIDWPQGKDVSQPPQTITFLQMFGAKSVEDLPLHQWWDEGSPYGFLCAPIGRISSASDMIFDLNDRDGSHGPHGLLGGMTGSGKSEVLKAIILALAVTHHPYDINFALIDFKGGAAFNELARLPHTVGVVTDIESNATFAERVIQALSGEIERRKRVLEDARAAFGFGRSHIDEFRKQQVRRPLPRLVIVFDEFAEFKQRNPAESKKLISIARQGRSLGVHLILATQNITAAVDPEILQNSSFRICLKVSEPGDSIQMVGIPDAVNLTRGRAYLASNTRILYQSAFSGAEYKPRISQHPGNEIVTIWPDGRREVAVMPPQMVNEAKKPLAATEAGAVVEHIVEIAKQLHIKKPQAVWPDALPEYCLLPELLSKHLSGGWDGQSWKACSLWSGSSLSDNPILPVLGLVDLPLKQTQFPLQMSNRQGGHLLVFGSAGSGKSTLLRTLVTSLALTQTPDQAHIYILDYGGQSALKVLEEFPHVGAVVTRLESERAERLVHLIQAEVIRRNNLLREARLDNWLDYNASVNDTNQLPALYLLIDGFRDFKAAFENEFVDEVTALVSGGQAAGLYLVCSANLQNDVPNDLFANINLRLSFNQADTTEYFRIVGTPSDAKLQEDAAKGVRPGRGLVRGTPPLEFQASLPTAGISDKEQSEYLINLAEKMRRSWNGRLPKPVETLPEHLFLPETPMMNHDPSLFSALGVDFETLLPTGFSLVEDGPAFLIGSVTGQAGKTSLLRTWLLSLAAAYQPEQFQPLIIDFHTRTLAPFRRLPHIRAYVGSKQALDEVLEKLRGEIDRRQNAVDKAYQKDPEGFNPLSALSQWPHIMLVIDDYDRFYQSMEGEVPLLIECIQRSSGLGFSFTIAGTMTDLPNAYSDHFVERFHKHGCGVLLGGHEGIEEFNNTRRPVGSIPAGLPPGRGYLVRRGRASLFQCATYWHKDELDDTALKAFLERIITKTTQNTGTTKK